LELIANYVTEGNCDKLLQLAEVHTTENLKRISQGKTPSSGDAPCLCNSQGPIIADAILKHGAIVNGDGFIGKEQALIKALNANK
jgi:hypothetical protein